MTRLPVPWPRAVLTGVALIASPLDGRQVCHAVTGRARTMTEARRLFWLIDAGLTGGFLGSLAGIFIGYRVVLAGYDVLGGACVLAPLVAIRAARWWVVRQR